MKQMTSYLTIAFKQSLLFCTSPADQCEYTENGKEQGNACPL